MTKTINDFYDAFLKLYADRPDDRIAVTDLARLAGYHRNTFYAHFRDVGDMLDKLKNRAADEIVCRAHRIFCSHSEMREASCREPRGFMTWLRLLFERDAETHFSEMLCEKCRPIWEDGYHSVSSGMRREIEIEYRMRGTIAALSYYCQHEPCFSLSELYTFLRDMAK